MQVVVPDETMQRALRNTHYFYDLFGTTYCEANNIYPVTRMLSQVFVFGQFTVIVTSDRTMATSQVNNDKIHMNYFEADTIQMHSLSTTNNSQFEDLQKQVKCLKKELTQLRSLLVQRESDIDKLKALIKKNDALPVPEIVTETGNSSGSEPRTLESILKSFSNNG